MARLQGEAALVTGASAGIGREAARALAKEGSDVALAARREERLLEIAEGIESEYGVETLVRSTDVSDPEAVAAVVEETVERFGGLDTVVANAAVGTGQSVEEVPLEEYRALMGVNVDGMFYTAREALPHLRSSAGNLIFVGSFAGQYPRPGSPLYAASKWWTRGFALSLAGAVGESGVAVTVVNPTEVRTEFGSGYRTPSKEVYDPGEVTEPETIADGIAFAAAQSAPDTVQELDLYRRDKFSGF